MKTRLTQKQETFCLKYFELGNATEAAKLAKYSPKTAQAIAAENLLKPVIQERLAELRKKAEDASVMSVLERKQRLSEIARAKLPDFMTLGEDGSWVNIGPETPNGAAISEMHSRTEYDKDGNCPTIYTSVKLHNPVNAIDLLNKMDNLYKENTVNPLLNVQINNNQNVQSIGDTDASAALAILISAGAVRLDAPDESQVKVDEIHPSQAVTEATRLPAP